MAIFRVEKSKDYTVMSNHHLRNSFLSLKAKGLLSQMLSLPEEWDYTLSGLARINKENIDAIRTAVKELEQAGYIQRSRTKNSDGTFGGNEYVIHEQPVFSEPSLENPTMEDPTLDNPSLEEPTLENPTQLNKDNNIIPPKAPQGGRRTKRSPKAQPDWKPERFAKFWDYYRTHCRGESKQAAIRAWDRLQPDDALIDRMAASLKKQIQSPDWQNGIGIPYASTWLNNARWEDEPKAAEGNQIPEPEPVDYF